VIAVSHDRGRYFYPSFYSATRNARSRTQMPWNKKQKQKTLLINSCYTLVVTLLGVCVFFCQITCTRELEAESDKVTLQYCRQFRLFLPGNLTNQRIKTLNFCIVKQESRYSKNHVTADFVRLFLPGNLTNQRNQILNFA